jgi:Ca-activated chloride channel family protein
VRTALFLTCGWICIAGTSYASDDVENARVSVTPRAVPPRKSGTAHSIRVDTNLVLVPVTVTDSFGAPFSGLTRQAFRLYENGVEQELKYFASEDAPVSLGIVFDASRSMEGRIDQSRAAVARFFNTAVPGDEFLLVEFNDAPRLLCPFTSDVDQIEKALVGIRPRNWTALLDAVYMAIHQMKRAKNPRKALLILSDGADNYSRYTLAEMKTLVREAGVSIYCIGIGGGLLNRHLRMLRHLSEETGGRLYEVDKMSDLPEAVANISGAIRSQYLLGFSPGNPNHDGLYRKIQVKLNQPTDQPPLRASWRSGYYAPAGE